MPRLVQTQGLQRINSLSNRNYLCVINLNVWNKNDIHISAWTTGTVMYLI